MKKTILTFALTVITVASFSAQTAKQVIDNYVVALGGYKKLGSVKTLSLKNKIKFNGLDMDGKTLKKENKFKTTQTMAGQDMIQVFDGENGYSSQMGQKTDFPADQIAKFKTAKIIDALGMDPANINTVEKKQVDGRDSFVLTSDDTTYYFDAKSNLLYKTVTGASMVTIERYTDVGGIKFVEEMHIDGAGQVVKVKNYDIKVNEPIADSEFK